MSDCPLLSRAVAWFIEGLYVRHRALLNLTTRPFDYRINCEMPLLNYTSRIPAADSINEISKMLAKAGARQIMHDYDDTGNIVALSFSLELDGKRIGFRLPSDYKPVQALLQQQLQNNSKARPWMRTEEHARIEVISAELIRQSSSAAGRAVKTDALLRGCRRASLIPVKLRDILVPAACPWLRAQIELMAPPSTGIIAPVM
jgi:hypothetical protein